MALTDRQRKILSLVADRYIRTGCLVPSKEVAGGEGLNVSPSTVRNEFAVLEEEGYLTHPHTSAGRMPTDRGYREFVNQVLSAPITRSTAVTVAGHEVAGEVDASLRQATEAMSRATNLLALALAPATSGARLRHVELLTLHPSQLMYVFIVSTGGVMKGIIDFPHVIDPGLVDWARTYLNETLADKSLTARMVRHALVNAELSTGEIAFLHSLEPAFQKLVDEQFQDELYVGGASRLLLERSVDDVQALQSLLALLEERFMLLKVLRDALGSGTVVVRIGKEHEATALKPFSMVTASYGLPQRRLGTVSLVGPTRMDYEKAISTVRETAHLLSFLVGERYE
jgi:heat-inducible transcriptional repressor